MITNSILYAAEFSCMITKIPAGITPAFFLQNFKRNYIMLEKIYFYLSKLYKKTDKKKSKHYFVKYLKLKINSINKPKTSVYDALIMEKIKNSCFKEKKIEKGIIAYNKTLNPIFYNILKNRTRNVNFILPDYISNYYKYLWKCEDLQNKVLFIFDYFSGFGDFIMYARYIPIIIKQAKKIIIEVNENLYDLYKYNFPNAEIILQKFEEYKNYDYTYHHELFLNLQKNLEHFPFPEGYLTVNPVLIEKFKPLFKTTKKKIGIFYESNSIINKHRSLKTKEILPLLENRNFEFYSLSKDPPDDLPINIINLSSHIKNANDTAAIMKNLDLVISTDSFPVHLAGALGIKAFLMLPYDSDWRWFNDIHKTAWYNSVTIFKQKSPNNWQDVIQHIKFAL